MHTKSITYHNASHTKGLRNTKSVSKMENISTNLSSYHIPSTTKDHTATHCQQIVNPLSRHCSQIVANIVHTLSTHCPHIVYTLSTHCPHIVHTLSTHCPHIVHTLSTHCLHIVHTLSIHCPQPYLQYTNTVTLIYQTQYIYTIHLHNTFTIHLPNTMCGKKHGKKSVKPDI